MTALAKRFLTNAILTIFALAVAFSFGEIMVRLLYKSRIDLFPRYHTDYHYGRYTIRGIRPNATYWTTSVDGSWKFVTNSKGFRNTKEFTYAKPPNALRVLSLGDSHTQGYEVRQEHTYSAVLERFLNFRGKEAEVINAGVSGFGTAEEVAFLENEGIRYSPDVVVLGFFANDFDDNVKAGLFGLDAGNRLTEEKYEHIPGVQIQNAIYSIPATQWLSENSYFYSLLFNTVWIYFKGRLSEFSANQVVVKTEGAPAAPVGEFEYAVPTSTTFSEYQIALTAALIERMHRFCSDRGIRFIVVDIPRSPQRYRFSSSVPPTLLMMLQAANIEYVSSQSVLLRLDGVAEMHAPHGQFHISEITHTLIGAELGERLLASVLRTRKQ